MFGFAAGVLSYETVPLPPVDDNLLNAQKAVLKRLNSQGLTTIIGRAQGLSTSVLRDLWAKDELTARTRIIMEFTRLNPNAEAYLKRIGNLTDVGDDMFKISGATVQPVDGATGDGAALSRQQKIRKRPQDPYEFGSNKWISYGPIHVDLPKEDTEWRSIQAANRYGWAISGIHSQGDLGSELLLKAFADANKERPIADRRFGFDHGLLRTQENFKMAHELGVIPSIGPKYLFMETPENLTFLYGADAVHKMTPVKSLIDMGIKPVLEADIAGEWSAPLWLMEALITRTDAEGRVWGPHEKISRQQALWMKTAWAARYSNDEEILGTIEAGKLADLVVLGGDFMTVPEKEIRTMPIVYTLVGGKVVYDLAKDGDVRTPHWDREGAFGATDDGSAANPRRP
jgi:predicted amidohydrolase YtcJ